MPFTIKCEWRLWRDAFSGAGDGTITVDPGAVSGQISASAARIAQNPGVGYFRPEPAHAELGTFPKDRITFDAAAMPEAIFGISVESRSFEAETEGEHGMEVWWSFFFSPEFSSGDDAFDFVDALLTPFDYDKIDRYWQQKFRLYPLSLPPADDGGMYFYDGEPWAEEAASGWRSGCFMEVPNWIFSEEELMTLAGLLFNYDERVWEEFKENVRKRNFFSYNNSKWPEI